MGLAVTGDRRIRSGSLCSGAGMLDLAVASLLDVEHAWFAEYEPPTRARPNPTQAPAKVLAAHWPDVPNHGDITAMDWTTAEPVDLMSAGVPCQGLSMAGRRRGSADERHIWPTGALPAIAAIRPQVFVFENVPGLLTIEHGGVWARILADLDDLGYNTSWTTVGACLVGACHHRHRVYAVATLADVPEPRSGSVARRDGDGWVSVQQSLFDDVTPVVWPASGLTRCGGAWSLPVRTCGVNGLHVLPTPRVAATRTSRSAILGSSSAPSIDQALEIARGALPRELTSWGEAPPSWNLLPTPAARDAERGAGKKTPEGAPLSEVIALLPTPKTSDIHGAGSRGEGGQDLRTAIARVSRPFRDITQDEYDHFYSQGKYASDPMLPTPRATDVEKGGPNQCGSSGDLMLPSAVQPERFGPYRAAIRRQEEAFGLTAPEPTEPGRLGRPRLNPLFPEWMIGLPAGWITNHAPRGDAIRIAGNGVVRQAAAYALTTLPTWVAAMGTMSGR